MVLFELLKLLGVFFDNLCKEYLWHVLIMPPTNRNGISAEISRKGEPAPLAATKRWVVERSGSWHNAHKKLL